MGKSTFALNKIRKCAKLGSPVMMFSVEMSEDNVVRNLTSAESHVDGMRLRRCELNQDELGRIVGASEKLASIPVYVDDTPAISISKVRARARKLKSQVGLSAVFIDYLQYVRGIERGQSREQEVSEVSRGLKSMAKELQIPVIALAQLNRNTQGRKDPTPLLSDLRESGAIEQDADVVILLHRPEYYDANSKPGVMETIIAKQRNGPTGSIDVTYIGNQFRVENLSEANNV
jgi:replicative DNA helicase